MFKVVCFMLILLLSLFLASSVDFNSDIEVIYGGNRAKIFDDGTLLQLSLDEGNGSGFQYKHEILYGRIDVKIKLVPGDSAGTVTTFYLSSQGDTRDEVDMEFLGNVSGEPYILHTNIYTRGKGSREQRFLVDEIPIRVYQNAERQGVPYLRVEPMRIYSTIWEASSWATRGGLVKVDWIHAPFTASYRGFEVNACVWVSGRARCPFHERSATQILGADERKKLKWVQNNYMIYNYCTDTKRFPQGLPPECTLPS
ncbi:hypothetical protein IFM89_003045 [Coptis chinensis]|uniref:Xyloglucan endotransglucosylase/hydrolase n=1 Tax=Coptis chinensis TaxID=261450 RepID=A0A835ISS7_9MAGN|nr:hypothetical protein IFM89_003045 [Coptis chinensis]